MTSHLTDEQINALLKSGELTEKEWLALKLRQCEARLKEAEALLEWTTLLILPPARLNSEIAAYFERKEKQ